MIHLGLRRLWWFRAYGTVFKHYTQPSKLPAVVIAADIVSDGLSRLKNRNVFLLGIAVTTVMQQFEYQKYHHSMGSAAQVP